MADAFLEAERRCTCPASRNKVPQSLALRSDVRRRFELRLTVLVVEDEMLVRMFASAFLDEAGFNVFEALNAEEAITAPQARSDVRVVITDADLPAR